MRHNQLFGDGNLSTSKNLYLSGAYLNPCMLQSSYLLYFMLMQRWLVYLNSDLFRKDLSPISGMEGIEHVSTFKTVTKFLVETAQNEILHGHREEFTRWKGRAKKFTAALLEEMKKYARRQYPFNNKVDENNGIIVWWKAFQGSDHAQILPVSADMMTDIDNERG